MKNNYSVDVHEMLSGEVNRLFFSISAEMKISLIYVSKDQRLAISKPFFTEIFLKF
jgi:hypothetical protein